MADDKRYFWIKLKTDFFSLPEIDFMMSQPNGKEYVCLYVALCLNTANNGGNMASKIGEILIPYNAEKIARDTKHFDVDTVKVAMQMFMSLGLVYEQEDRVLRIAAIDTMVGSESKWAQYKRGERNEKKLDNVQKRIGQSTVRDKSKEIEIDKDKRAAKAPRHTNQFNSPSVEDVKAYCDERRNRVDPERFVDFYASKGWMIGKNKMKDWKAAVRTWEKNDLVGKGGGKRVGFQAYDQGEPTDYQGIDLLAEARAEQ